MLSLCLAGDVQLIPKDVLELHLQGSPLSDLAREVLVRGAAAPGS